MKPSHKKLIATKYKDVSKKYDGNVRELMNTIDKNQTTTDVEIMKKNHQIEMQNERHAREISEKNNEIQIERHARENLERDNENMKLKMEIDKLKAINNKKM